MNLLSWGLGWSTGCDKYLVQKKLPLLQVLFLFWLLLLNPNTVR